MDTTANGQETGSGLYSPTPYDDAFRTMESECDDLLIPLVNYFFNESYRSDAVVTRLRNEHFIEKPDGTEEKRITDSHFGIRQDGKTKLYHIECESSDYDGSVLVRMFEYTSQIALDGAERGRTTLRVSFPCAGLLLLRGGNKAPDKAEVVISTPDGEISYNIPIIRRADIGVDEIFGKRLYFLIPFYILNYEKSLDSIDADEAKQEELLESYREIHRRLSGDLKERKLSLFSFGVIIEAMRRVAYNMMSGHEGAQKKVGEMMGGQIMDLEWIRAWKEAEAKGEAKGRTEGEAKGKAEAIAIFITDKREDGISEDVIREKLMRLYKLTDEDADGYLAKETNPVAATV